MDSKGGALDNIYIERSWRMIRYQHPATDGLTLCPGIKGWLEKYHYRAHQGIGRKEPADKYSMAA